MFIYVTYVLVKEAVMKKTFGVFAHVDSGKTTFCEQLISLIASKQSDKAVYEKYATLDSHELEIKRGITIFADQVLFDYNGDRYYFIDTPGHMDFSGEAERSIPPLDYAILLIDGTKGVQAHTITLFRLLESYHIPTFLFINKLDMLQKEAQIKQPTSFEIEQLLAPIIESITHRLTSDICLLSNPSDFCPEQVEQCLSTSNYEEILAEKDDVFLEAYLNDSVTPTMITDCMRTLIQSRKLFPIGYGSSLNGDYLLSFFHLFHILTCTNYEDKTVLNEAFQGVVYKIRHDKNNRPIHFVKAIQGTLQVKDEFLFSTNIQIDSKNIIKEKVNELRFYNGTTFTNTSTVSAGDSFAIIGLSSAKCGDSIVASPFVNDCSNVSNFYLSSAIWSRVLPVGNVEITDLLHALQQLEAEEPLLSVDYHTTLKEIHVHVMGNIQLEVLKQLISDRFGYEIDFEPPKVVYAETIKHKVMGYGHFEPLRHYAEVNLLLSPNKANTGITFESNCHVDVLGKNYQHLIEQHIFEKVHKGILTGFPITDIHITLIAGRAHLKHTEGGDFREATYRAIRQGLEKADNVLLEPYYEFEINGPMDCLGKVLSDIPKMSGSFEAPKQHGDFFSLNGRGPVSTFMNYSTDLISYSKGLASISYVFCGYDLCHNPDEVIASIGYNKGEDKENPSSSVFCAKGTSFVVNWNEAEEYMHCIER